VDNSSEMIYMSEFPVLIGDSEPVMVELITELITEVIGKALRPVVFSSGYGEDLRQLAKENDIRIFCLTINNIMFRTGPLPYEKRVKLILELVSEVKRKYYIPVIISGVEDMLTEEVRKSDADAIIEAPFNLEDYRTVLKRIL